MLHDVALPGWNEMSNLTDPNVSVAQVEMFVSIYC